MYSKALKQGKVTCLMFKIQILVNHGVIFQSCFWSEMYMGSHGFFGFYRPQRTYIHSESPKGCLYQGLKFIYAYLRNIQELLSCVSAAASFSFCL